MSASAQPVVLLFYPIVTILEIWRISRQRCLLSRPPHIAGYCPVFHLVQLLLPSPADIAVPQIFLSEWKYLAGLRREWYPVWSLCDE